MEQLPSVITRLDYLILLLFLPGYFISTIFFSEKQLSRGERITWSLALSVAVIGLGGLFLHLPGVTLNSSNWLYYVLAVTGLAAVGTLMTHPSRLLVIFKGGFNLQPVTLLTVTASLVVIIGAIGLASQQALVQRSTFTQFWAVPDGNGKLEVGLHNEELKTETYQVVILADGLELSRFDNIKLEADQTWQQQVLLPGTDSKTRIEALLYRGDSATPYRQTKLWLKCSRCTFDIIG